MKIKLQNNSTEAMKLYLDTKFLDIIDREVDKKISLLSTDEITEAIENKIDENFNEIENKIKLMKPQVIVTTQSFEQSFIAGIAPAIVAGIFGIIGYKLLVPDKKKYKKIIRNMI